mmetsp:Transcript_5457/g.23073  ORF Transcript_5457/g.23073 Transcript_5457/m.23073 type:complete len:219 (-) Transcript_5457:29-685(-)
MPMPRIVGKATSSVEATAPHPMMTSRRRTALRPLQTARPPMATTNATAMITLALVKPKTKADLAATLPAAARLAPSGAQSQGTPGPSSQILPRRHVRPEQVSASPIRAKAATSEAAAAMHATSCTAMTATSCGDKLSQHDAHSPRFMPAAVSRSWRRRAWACNERKEERASTASGSMAGPPPLAEGRPPPRMLGAREDARLLWSCRVAGRRGGRGTAE